MIWLSVKCKVKRLIIVAILFTPALVMARVYRINLVVFTQMTSQSLQSEKWHSRLYRPQMSDWVNLKANDPTAKNFQLLTQSNMQLRGIGRLLHRQGRHILLDVAWLQSNQQASQWVHIFGGKAYDKQGHVIDSIKPMLHQFNDQQTPAYWQLNGAIKVSFGRFIYVSSRLFLTMPVSEISGVSNDDFGAQYGLVPLQTFSIIQMQRALLNHFLYFDHPLFGALVYIQAYK